jgi:exodeoxyribonuclease VII small subunit
VSSRWRSNPQHEETMVARKKSSLEFEKALQELESLVAQLEQGDLPLEESLKQFERGIALTRACQTALKDAEQKIEMLAAHDKQETIEPFESDAELDDRD